MYRLLVTKKERSAFPSVKHCQGQLQTPQSGSVVFLVQGMGLLQGIYLQRITQTQGIIRISPGPDGIGILDPNSSGKTNYMPYNVEPL
jgi:hypothetical protein